jgi:hypothetical protein
MTAYGSDASLLRTFFPGLPGIVFTADVVLVIDVYVLQQDQSRFNVGRPPSPLNGIATSACSSSSTFAIVPHAT